MGKHLRTCLLGLFMLLAAALTVAGCGSDSASADTSSNTTKTQTANAAASSANSNSDAKAQGNKILVAYYSATGRTRTAAQAIANATGGDLFEIVPQQPYSDADLDYNNQDSRVTKEHNDPANRHVALKQTTPNNFQNYDVVFIGYPIWWGDASWVVDDFVKNNNFAGKTVIPFATSFSSPLGRSGENLQALAKTGNWKEGACFDRSMTPEKVAEWAKSVLQK